MVRQVVWSPGALEDLAEIRGYLERSSPGNAERVVNRIAEAAEATRHFPLRGRIIPEFGDPNGRETSCIGGA
jgi:plasmid stabilization system protein ParE